LPAQLVNDDVINASAEQRGLRDEPRVWPDELKSVSLATGLGAASSSCSYAAVTAARSAIQQGAALIPALAFMFASTNLVIELGAVLWVLMGWQFVLAEFFAAFLLNTIMWLMIRLFLPKNLEAQIRERAGHQAYENRHCHRPLRRAPAWQASMSRNIKDENGREWRTRP